MKTNSDILRVECPEHATNGSTSKGNEVSSVFCVYILECADHTFYVGHTNNLPVRLRMHKEGRAALHTKNRLPLRLVYHETAVTEVAAVRRERQIKRWSQAKKRALVAGDLAQLRSLSVSRD